MTIKGRAVRTLRAAKHARLSAAHRDAARAPMQNTILFESWRGKSVADSPRAIYEEFASRTDIRGQWRPIWALNRGVAAPTGIEVVRRGSAAYARAIAGSRAIVSNDALDPLLVPEPRTFYLQTWHGTPLKKLGVDLERADFQAGPYLRTFLAETKTWDVLLAPNEFSAQAFARAFAYPGTILTGGTPRNDILADPTRLPAARTAARRALGLAENETAVLYAPTWRDTDRDALGRYRAFGSDALPALVEALPAGHRLVYRGHHLVRAANADTGVIDSRVLPDTRDALAAADILVTDYSSIMFDWAIRDLPLVLYTPDLAEYRDHVRGFYFDLFTDPPGPVAMTIPEVADALRDLADGSDSHGARRASFRDEFCSLEDGHAASRAVDALLTAIG